MLPQSAPSVAILMGLGEPVRAERLEVRLPGRSIGEELDRVHGERVDPVPGAMAGSTTQFGNDRITVLGRRRHPGRARSHARARISRGGDPARHLQDGPQHRLGLGNEGAAVGSAGS
jgi:hypothetical protein